MQNYRNSGSEKTYDVIGVMSGTSVDGLDLACCRFEFKNQAWNFEILATRKVNYSDDWKERLLNVIHASQGEIFKLDIDFGEFVGLQINDFIHAYKINPRFIASHGHTVFHQPQKRITVQIGDGLTIHQITGITTINDFRRLDVILGGQGAPLVPIGDAKLFPQYPFCLNLGGFSNVSFDRAGKRIAYDICPVNIVLNRLARLMGFPFDENGNIAREGKVIKELQDVLNGLEYYQIPFPKSLGLEWVNEQVMPILEKFHDIRDVITTFTHHAVYQITRSITQLKTSKAGNQKILVTGGGAYNIHLLELLRKESHGTIIYEIPDSLLVDFKEAIIFGFLGVLRWRGEINSMSSVTGAVRDSCGGTIHDNYSFKNK